MHRESKEKTVRKQREQRHACTVGRVSFCPYHERFTTLTKDFCDLDPPSLDSSQPNLLAALKHACLRTLHFLSLPPTVSQVCPLTPFTTLSVGCTIHALHKGARPSLSNFFTTLYSSSCNHQPTSYLFGYCRNLPPPTLPFPRK